MFGITAGTCKDCAIVCSSAEALIAIIGGYFARCWLWQELATGSVVEPAWYGHVALIKPLAGGPLAAASKVAMLLHEEPGQTTAYYMDRLAAAETLEFELRDGSCLGDVSQAVNDVEMTIDALIRHQRLWELVKNHLAITGIVTANDARTFQQACAHRAAAA